MGLQKVRGRGQTNTCLPPRSDTAQVIVGNGTYVGKAAKRGAYVKGARAHWNARTARGVNGSSTCGDQQPSSVKCR